MPNVFPARFMFLLGSPALAIAVDAFAQTTNPLPVTRMPEVLVTAPVPSAQEEQPDNALLNTDSIRLSPLFKAAAADTPALLAKEAPGAAVVRNGPQTGIVQLRGLSGDRVRTVVSGMHISPACPNHMDPPLHYAPVSRVNSIVVMAGITPVSHGGDSIGGTVLVEAPQIQFSTNAQVFHSGELGSFFRSSNDGYGFNGSAGLANEVLGVRYDGSWQRANDLRFPGGRVRDTGFHTQQHDFRSALKNGRMVWEIDGGIVRTRDSGTPALPMDMIEDDAWHTGLRHDASWTGGAIASRAYYHHIDHLMDNHSLRPLAPGTMRMSSPAQSEDYGLAGDINLPRDLHTFRAGTGFHRNEFKAHQRNDLTGMRQDTLRDAHRTRIGTYAEWQADWTDQWMTLAGLRNDTVLTDAAEVGRWFKTGAADAARFNRRDRDFADVNLDLTASVRFVPNRFSDFELAFARKNRAPSLIERYLWTPLSASAGQADGRTYLGNLELQSETSHQVAATADFHGERWQLQATPFYNFVTDYIQGTATPRLDQNGRPVLQFQNLGRADLYGVDARAEYQFHEQFALRGTLSWVRGIDRDNGDNLYRIAPLRGSIVLDHRFNQWESSAELVLADEQTRVARYNGEPPTQGFAVLHLRTSYMFPGGFGLQIGLENVLDTRYAEHLSGVNRVLGSDVRVGQRVPGAGRFVYVAAQYRF